MLIMGIWDMTGTKQREKAAPGVVGRQQKVKAPKPPSNRHVILITWYGPVPHEATVKLRWPYAMVHRYTVEDLE